MGYAFHECIRTQRANREYFPIKKATDTEREDMVMNQKDYARHQGAMMRNESSCCSQFCAGGRNVLQLLRQHRRMPPLTHLSKRRLSKREGLNLIFHIPLRHRRLNIVLILLDDVGFDASKSTFGGPCDTPTLDRLAANGHHYRSSTAISSPARALLLPAQPPRYAATS